MPHTQPEEDNDTAHVWLDETLVDLGGEPLCRASVSGTTLIPVRERGMSAGSPRHIRDWVMWREVCRECAELMVDHMGLHLAPLQWVPQVGEKRRLALNEAGVESIHGVVDRYLFTDADASAPGYATGHLMDQTGLSTGGARQVLKNVSMENWREETERRGIKWLIEMVEVEG